MKRLLVPLAGLVAAALASLVPTSAFSAVMGTAFTYQGRLDTTTGPATGVYDFEFSLWNVSSGAGQVGATLTRPATGVTNGIFTVSLDFGSGIFAGDARWLQIGARTNGAPSYVTLTPRQPLTPAPGAIYAANAGAATTATSAGTATSASSATVATSVVDGAVSSNSIASGQVVKSLNGLKDNVTLAGGGNITVSPSGQTISLFSPTDWHIIGNAGTTPGANFLGTLDNQALEFKVNSQRAMRFEPQANNEHNLIGGSSANAVRAGSVGNTISGGGSSSRGGNSIDANYGAIGGGYGNQIATNADISTISGGSANLILSNAYQSTIGGGYYHRIYESAFDSTIAGGWQNAIDRGAYGATIAGGMLNSIHTNAAAATIGGGGSHSIETGANNGTIGGGVGNTIQQGASSGTIGGGQGNRILPQIGSATIGGGASNTNGGFYATIPGGFRNVAAGANSLAAGTQAKANHTGAFVWADSLGADFSSTANDQFLIRAGGGVGIGKNNPVSALDVNGTVTASAFVGDGSGLTGIESGGLANGAVTSLQLASDTNSLSRVSGGRATVSGSRIMLPSVGPIDTNMFTGLALQYNSSFGEGAIMSSYADGFGSLSFYTKRGGGSPVAKQMVIDRYGGVAIDQTDSNDGAINNGSSGGVGLTFGPTSGEGIASKRTVGGNRYGLDFYTGYTPKLNIDWYGNVGIGTGTNLPTEKLDIHGTVRVNDSDLYLRGNTDRNHGLGYRSSVASISVDGPFLYGWNGGGLGTSGPDELSLKWDWHGNVWVSNNLSVATLTVRGGSDVAEPFPVHGAAAEPGTVMVIDPDHPGHLIPSTQGYDTRVAGIVSGAGGVKPGLELQQDGILDQGQKVALTGRVYVKTEALNSPVKPGDLLTTSPVAGHAMKATDRERAQGAILGKAMTGLSEGQGLVLVLVTLQ